MAQNSGRDFSRTGFSVIPGQPYNWDPRGYAYEWENRQYRNRNRNQSRNMSQYRENAQVPEWEYGEYPSNYSFGPYRYNYYEEPYAQRDFEGTAEPNTWYYEEYWSVPGPYQGVGPRGYQRSDDDICQTVCERLTQNGELDASEMQVDVDHGEVTLKGEVDSRRSKKLAERIADSVNGVKDVHNDLHIRQHETHKTSK